MTKPIQTSEKIRALIAEMIAQECSIEVESVDFSKPFTEYGFDSIAAMTVSGALEDALERELPTTLLWDCPTPDALVDFLLRSSAENGASVREALA